MPTSATRVTVPHIVASKGGTPLVALTCYSAPFARILDPHVDVLLVGDSLGMVLYGMDSTLPVSLELMIAHGRAVAKTAEHALVVVDMPFGSYQGSQSAAFDACARVLKETGCAAVKLEGGEEMADTVAFLVARGIPVMGHVALMPQRVHSMGGYHTQGRIEAERKKILADADAIAKAGAFSIVLEGLVEDLAAEISRKTAVPTIGIGASPVCDGQVLVMEDMAGLTGGHLPHFVKQYASLGASLEQAVKQYAEEVKSRAFPAPEHCYPAKKK